MDDILLLGSGFVDPHIFTDPDPEPVTRKPKCCGSLSWAKYLNL